MKCLQIVLLPIKMRIFPAPPLSLIQTPNAFEILNSYLPLLGWVGEIQWVGIETK